LNQFGKCEAEWVQEVLDMHEGDEPSAREAVLKAVERIIETRKSGEGQLTSFEQTVDACCFASRMWWPVGIARLKELGRLT